MATLTAHLAKMDAEDKWEETKKTSLIPMQNLK